MPEYERFDESLNDPYLAHEHAHRYWWASTMVKDKSIIDIACGTGYGSRILSQYANHVTGIDLSADAIESARRQHLTAKTKFLEGNCDSFSLLMENKVDTVVSFETIEHLSKDDQQLFLSQIKKVLKEDGQLIISTPNKSEYFDNKPSENPYHLHEMSMYEFIETLSDNFRNVKLAGQRMIPASWISAVVDGKMQINGCYSTESIHHGKGICNLEHLFQFSPVYIIAICSDAEVAALPETNTLFDASYSFYISNSTKANPLETRVSALENELNKQIDRLSEEIHSVDIVRQTLLQRMSLIESNVNQNLNDIQMTTGELSNELRSVKSSLQNSASLESRIAAIESELLIQIERISQLKKGKY